MPSMLRLTAAIASSAVTGAHLIVLWWHQRVGEPDEFMRISYDLTIDSSATEFALPFAALSLPAEENLLCFRACRDRSVCPCQEYERFAIGSIMVVIDENGDGDLSLDEIRAQQIGGSATVVAWSPSPEPYPDNLTFRAVHQGFAAYSPDETRTLRPTTSANVAASISFCESRDASCSFAVPHIFCNSPSCARDGELNRFGL